MKLEGVFHRLWKLFRCTAGGSRLASPDAHDLLHDLVHRAARERKTKEGKFLFL